MLFSCLNKLLNIKCIPMDAKKPLTYMILLTKVKYTLDKIY